MTRKMNMDEAKYVCEDGEYGRCEKYRNKRIISAYPGRELYECCCLSEQ